MNRKLKDVLIRNDIKSIVFYGISQSQYPLSSEEKKLWNVYYMDMDIPISAEDEYCIHDLYEAAEKNIKAYVIMRQMIAHKSTFEKLLSYSKQYNANIYDQEGRDIGKICNEVVQRKPLCNREALMNEILKHDFISFDIFDTLLMRKVLLPEDVFLLTEQRMASRGIVIENFKNKRIEAQSELGLTNPCIRDIYNSFSEKYQITPEIASQCMEMELAVENEVLVPRYDMVKIFQECIERNKKVYLISDMYLTYQDLVPILERYGISGYTGIYISCEKKKLKLQGLFRDYREDVEKTENGSFLHIGDHVIHDAICSQLEQIDSCLIAGAYNMAQNTLYKKCIENAQSLVERVALGLSVSKILNSPFAVDSDKGTINIERDDDYGYGFCGPLLTQFAIYIYEEVKKQGVDNVLFASRDGYLMKKMYQILCDKRHERVMPEGIYFYTSRKAAVMTCVDNEAYINMLIDISSELSPEKMMKERFGLDESQILPYDSQKYDIIHKYVWAHVDKIFERSYRAKKNYYKYMGNSGLQIGKKYAFMDFVSSGTSQKSLARIVPFEIIGIYAGWNSRENKTNLGIEALYTDLNSFFLSHYKIMETFMASDEPSLSHFDDNGRPVFQEQERSRQEVIYVHDMQKACMSFFEDFLNLTKNVSGSIENGFADSVFAVSVCAKFTNTESVLNSISLMDDWSQIRLNKERMIQDYNGR